LHSQASLHSAKEQGKEILLLESDAVQRDLLRLILEREGYVVETTGDPARAETLLRTREFYTVLLEILLPGINGLKLIRTIREDPSLHQPNFILISALGFKEVIQQAASLNVSGFLKKPVDPAVLLERLAGNPK
jgi:CheY-like chemotaxis protein